MRSRYRHCRIAEETVQAFDQREAEMRAIADGIADPAIRGKSEHLIDLDASIIDTWSKTVATPAPAGASDAETSSAESRFMTEFQRYAADHKKTTDDLTSTCGGLK